MADLSQYGIVPGVPGLAGQPELFLALAEEASRTCCLSLSQVIHNHHLVNLLFNMSRIPNNEIIVNNYGNPVSLKIVLIGGTSLAVAWEIGDRFSEDVDTEVIIGDPESVSVSAAENALKELAKSTNAQRLTIASTGINRKRKYLKHEFQIGQNDKTGILLKLETVIQPHDPSIVEPCSIRSYIGRVADKNTLARYPELGGFELLCQTPDATAIAKLDAMHRRAVHQLYEELIERARDLYDTASIAKTQWGKLSNERIIHLSERAINGPALVPSAPRPKEGYSASPAFEPSTEAYAALKRGYLHLPKALGIVDIPDFEEAVKLTRSIDPGPTQR